jgi:hypothetical protein
MKMNRQIAMVVAGFITSLVVIGGTVVAAQSGVLSTSTTMIQANGEINVPKVVQQPVVQEPTATVTVQPTDTPDVVIITTTEVMPIQYITKTVVVEKRDTSREAILLARLNDAYKQMKDRDSAYQAKLQEAYNQLATANAASQQNVSQPNVSPQAAPAADNSQSAAPSNAPAAPDPAPAVNPTPAHHEDDHKTEVQKPEDHKPEYQKPEDPKKP